jgi:hypothetical protein
LHAIAERATGRALMMGAQHLTDTR